MSEDSKREPVTVRGVVLAVEWNENDDPVLVSIDTGEVEYQVDDDAQGRLLLPLVSAEVEARGSAYEDSYGVPYLTLEGFQVLQAPEPSTDDGRGKDDDEDLDDDDLDDDDLDDDDLDDDDLDDDDLDDDDLDDEDLDDDTGPADDDVPSPDDEAQPDPREVDKALLFEQPDDDDDEGR